MGCCGSKADEPARPTSQMSGSQVVGKQGSVAVNRDEQRQRAAAAAEARAQQQNTRGQQGATSKIKKRPESPSQGGGGVEKNLVWD